MAFVLTLSELSSKDRRQILHRFTVQPAATQYNPNPPKYYCFRIDKADDSLYLPLGTWQDYYTPSSGFPNGESSDFPRVDKDVKFTGKLLTAETDPSGRGRDQNVVAAQALKRLESTGSVFIAAHTGHGKSALAVYLSLTLGLKTVVVCHFDMVRRQWPGEYATFSDNRVTTQFLTGKNCKLDPNADVYIVGVQKASMMSAEDFITIGTVIIDEAHISTVAAFTKALLKFQPRYLIGLSATPDRADGLDSLLTHYFGTQKEFIIRREVKNFVVYKLQTPFKPEISYTVVRGKTVPNWNAIINSIEENPKRHELIAKLAMEYPDEKIIILCQRNVSASGIYEILKEKAEDVGLLIGSTKTYDKTKRILVAGYKKCGTGFNDSTLTMAIIASDTKDVRQYEGRIRTINNKIFHLVDDYRTFEKHWKLCEEWYRQKGATFETINTKPSAKSKTLGKTKSFLKR